MSAIPALFFSLMLVLLGAMIAGGLFPNFFAWLGGYRPEPKEAPKPPQPDEVREAVLEVIEASLSDISSDWRPIGQTLNFNGAELTLAYPAGSPFCRVSLKIHDQPIELSQRWEFRLRRAWLDRFKGEELEELVGFVHRLKPQRESAQ